MLAYGSQCTCFDRAVSEHYRPMLQKAINCEFLVTDGQHMKGLGRMTYPGRTPSLPVLLLHD